MWKRWFWWLDDVGGVVTPETFPVLEACRTALVLAEDRISEAASEIRMAFVTEDRIAVVEC